MIFVFLGVNTGKLTICEGFSFLTREKMLPVFLTKSFGRLTCQIVRFWLKNVRGVPVFVSCCCVKQGKMPPVFLQQFGVGLFDPLVDHHSFCVKQGKCWQFFFNTFWGLCDLFFLTGANAACFSSTPFGGYSILIVFGVEQGKGCPLYPSNPGAACFFLNLWPVFLTEFSWLFELSISRFSIKKVEGVSVFLGLGDVACFSLQ